MTLAATFDFATVHEPAELKSKAYEGQSGPVDDASSQSDMSSVEDDSNTAGPASTATVQRKDWRPKSTLHLKTRQEMNWMERLTARAGLMHPGYYEKAPEGHERRPIQKHSVLREHVWILSRGFFAPVVQQLSYFIFPNFKWPAIPAYIFYWFSFTFFAIGCVRRFDRFAAVYGTHDQHKIGRDRIPDRDIPNLTFGFFSFLMGRTAGEFLLRWDQTAQPLMSFSWDTPFRYFAFLVVMDYFFYVYHRSCHEIDGLWKVHYKHHMTKHPNPVLSILADGWQELIEIALVPLCAAMIVPMTFHETYIMILYTTYVEIFGHTGIRADWPLPIAGPVLKPFGLDLIVEEHDLHHRYGKSGKNYGKQTKIWDVLFGTTCPREEMADLHKGERKAWQQIAWASMLALHVAAYVGQRKTFF